MVSQRHSIALTLSSAKIIIQITRYSLLFIPGMSSVIINIILPNQSPIRPESFSVNEAIFTPPLKIYLGNSQKAIFCLPLYTNIKK